MWPCKLVTLVLRFFQQAVEGKKGETVLVRKRGLSKRKDSDGESSDEDYDEKTPRKPRPEKTSTSVTNESDGALAEKSQNVQKSEPSSTTTASTTSLGREVWEFRVVLVPVSAGHWPNKCPVTFKALVMILISVTVSLS